MPIALRRALLAACAFSIVAGCATLPPGAAYPRTESSALADSGETRLAHRLAAAKAAHPGMSGFKLLPVGLDRRPP